MFLLGRSQSRMALFSVLTCLIVTSSIAQAATPAIDLKEAVDTFVQSIPDSGQGGYKDPTTDIIARTRLVEGFKKARNGQLSAARKQLALVNYTATLYVDSGTGREVVILQEQKVKGAYPRAWGLYVIAWPPKQNLSNLVVEVPHACPRMSRRGVMEATRTLTLSAWKLSGRPTLTISSSMARSAMPLSYQTWRINLKVPSRRFMRRQLTRNKWASGLKPRCTRPTASLRETTTAKKEIRLHRSTM